MVRIALLCNGLGVVNRGAERFSVEFLNHLSDIFDIDLIGIKDTGTKSRKEIKIPWRNGRAYWESYLFGRHLYKYDLLKDYDLIINNSGFPCSYWCNKIRNKYNVPFVTRARGGGREEKLSKYFKPDMMIFLTDQHRKQIAKDAVSSVTIPNAIDVDFYQNHKPPEDLADGLERPIFLSTSAFVGYKRSHLLIKAVEELGNGTLVMAGDGQLRDETVNLGKGLLGKRFKYLGLVDRNSLLDWYKTADVFVNASGSEAFGVVFLEALSSGIPVVTQNDARRRDIIGDAGVLVDDCSNITSFADGLKIAYAHNWNNNQVEQARKFDWNIIKQLYVETINNILDGKKGRVTICEMPGGTYDFIFKE